MLGYSNAGIPDKSWQPPVAVIETTMGSLVVEMYWKHAPISCRNFMELVRRGYYNNTKFHRVIRDFMIQGGDPTGTGKGGQSIYGPQFDDEISPDLKHTGAGVLSMANAGPDSNGSQFFITLAPTQWLDGKHTIFGRVQSGMAVVKRIGLVECDKNDCPVDDIRIDKAYIPNSCNHLGRPEVQGYNGWAVVNLKHKQHLFVPCASESQLQGDPEVWRAL